MSDDLLERTARYSERSIRLEEISTHSRESSRSQHRRSSDHRRRTGDQLEESACHDERSERLRENHQGTHSVFVTSPLDDW